MRLRILCATLLAFAMYVEAQEAIPPADQSLQGAVTAPATSTLPSATPSKADALILYNQGRSLESAGKKAEAAVKYRESVTVCDKELANDPTRMDAYTVKCWSLFRLERYREVVTIGTAGLKVKFDARIVEVMGEAYYFLGDDASAIKYLQRYLENVGEYGDRVPTAYFYLAESFVRQKRLDHADIAYSLAVYREPNIARWWYRYATLVESLAEYARAGELYSRALRLSPGMAEALAGQARVKARL